MAAVQTVVKVALLYTRDGRKKKEASESEVEEWLKRWKNGEETRVLVTDEDISRGWEASCVVAIAPSATLENLVMRSCGFCILVKAE